LSDFKNGWIAGKFKPSLVESNIEVGYRKYDILEKFDESHYHAKTDEYNLVISGRVTFGIKKRKRYSHWKFYDVLPGQIIKIPKNHITRFTSLTKSEILCIKYPAYKKPDKIVI
jgi:cupin superfamily acireductone dioxygenase involved in methionine salvage